MKNDPGRLPEGKPSKWDPKEIVHRILFIKHPGEGQPIQFGIRKPERDPPPGADIIEYAKSVARRGASSVSLADPTQWDIPIYNQCWVLIELDKGITNWQFRDGGIVSKGTDEGYDFGTRWVRPGGAKVEFGSVDVDKVQVMYFGVGQRIKGGHHHFNFLIEFLEPETDRRLPVIFDPDVPNEGNTLFP